MLLMLAFVALPMAARAHGVDFTVTASVRSRPRPPGLQLPPGTIYRRWSATIDGERHSFVVTASPFKGDLGHQVDVELAAVKSRHAIDVVREEAEPLCGAPSIRVSYAYRKQLRYEYRYVAVGGRAHRQLRAGRRCGRPGRSLSLTTLCSGFISPRGPWAGRSSRRILPTPAHGSRRIGRRA